LEFVSIKVRDVIVMHDTTISLSGGTAGILNEGNIEGCIEKVTQTYYGYSAYDNIYSKAAALLECLTKTHPFTDGNKRSALLAIQLLLDVNGLAFRPDETTEDRCKEIAQCKHNFEDIEHWIRDCTFPKDK
jgi:death on curing protein